MIRMLKNTYPIVESIFEFSLVVPLANWKLLLSYIFFSSIAITKYGNLPIEKEMTCILEYSEFVDMFDIMIVIEGFYFLVHYPKKNFTFPVFLRY